MMLNVESIRIVFFAFPRAEKQLLPSDDNSSQVTATQVQDFKVQVFFAKKVTICILIKTI